ncbi:DUF4253 domain-containing protein [Actinomadura fibrosa]|uniref:DUF4253 domain-containing protein n=1 Tax=Actinomadura fibrosa TaxID=111802 RepID=A0ABW2XXR8_9ACTN|nr:DUF4253 domain-containing protein [Actinomadura fibrosa]
MPDPGFGGDADREVLWVSDERLPDLGGLWCRLYGERERTGLYPLLLDTLHGDPERPWHAGELGYTPVEEIDALDAGETLQELLAEHERELWTGLAAPGVEVEGPDACAEMVAEAFAERSRWLLGLVPAARGADALSLAGWGGPCNHTGTAMISAVVRSWEERFGTRVVAVGFDVLELSVGAPPMTLEHARAVAVEHLAFCPDNIWQGVGDIGKYAERLVDCPRWGFWWD